MTDNYGEPWMTYAVSNGDFGVSANGSVVFQIDRRVISREQCDEVHSLLLRAIACVNFLAGVPTELLERPQPSISQIRDRIREALSGGCKDFAVLELAMCAETMLMEYNRILAARIDEKPREAMLGGWNSPPVVSNNSQLGAQQ